MIPSLSQTIAEAELHLHRGRAFQHVVADHAGDLRILRILQGNHHQPGVATDIGVVPHDREIPRSAEQIVGIESHVALEEVVERIPVQKRAGADQDQALVLVGHVQIAIHAGHLLLVVLRAMRARGVGGDGSRRSNRRGILRLDVEALPQGRYGGGRDSFRKGLVVDEGDVKHAQPSLAAGGIQIFAAGLQAQDLVLAEGVQDVVADVFARMLVGVPEDAAGLDVLAVIVGIGQGVQAAADDGLGLFPLGHLHGIQTAIAGGHPAIAADEVDEVRALHQELGHDGVVVFVLRYMAVAAHLGLEGAGPRELRRPRGNALGQSAADGVRHVGAEGDAAEPLAGDGLLLHVNRLAVAVVGTDVDRARGPRRPDAVARRVAVAGQHEDVVAEGLEIVGDVVLRYVALEVQAGHLHVRRAGADGSRSNLDSRNYDRRCSSSGLADGPSWHSPGLPPQVSLPSGPNPTVLAMCERTL